MNLRSRSRILASRERFTFVVTTKSGQSYRGALFDHDQHCLVLRKTEALNAVETGPIPVDGELILLWADVDFMNRA